MDPFQEQTWSRIKEIDAQISAQYQVENRNVDFINYLTAERVRLEQNAERAAAEVRAEVRAERAAERDRSMHFFDLFRTSGVTTSDHI